MRKIVMLIVTLALATTLHAAVVGWNNDGTGDYGRDCKPPLSFDGVKGTNILWKAPLPNWSQSSPIVIEPADGKGPVRVVCVAESLDYSPILLCFDADTGKELWRRELDAVAAMPKEQQEEARALAKRLWALNRIRKSLTVDIKALPLKDKGAWENGKITEAANSIMEKAKVAGLEFHGVIKIDGAGMDNNYFDFARDAKSQQDGKRLADLGLKWSQWDNGTWDGVAYPTPLSDGQRILTVTAQNLYSCHDLDGNLLWQTRFAPPKASDFTPEQLNRLKDSQGKKIRWEGDMRGFETSPVLADDLLISNSAGAVRAVDIKTGQTRWIVPVAGQLRQGMAVPALITVDTERYVIGVTASKTSDNPILRLRDGVAVLSLPGHAMPNTMNGPIVVGDTIVNVQDNALVCRRLIKEGDGLTLVEQWRTSDKSMMEWALMRVPWRDGMAYLDNGVFNLREGKKTSSWSGILNRGYYGQGGILAGGYYLGWDFYSGKFFWRDLVTGKKAGDGVLPVNPSDGLPLTLRREQTMGTGWMWISAATPFAYKDRLYVRADDFLWCIGQK